MSPWDKHASLGRDQRRLTLGKSGETLPRQSLRRPATKGASELTQETITLRDDRLLFQRTLASGDMGSAPVIPVRYLSLAPS